MLLSHWDFSLQDYMMSTSRGVSYAGSMPTELLHHQPGNSMSRLAFGQSPVGLYAQNQPLPAGKSELLRVPLSQSTKLVMSVLQLQSWLHLSLEATPSCTLGKLAGVWGCSTSTFRQCRTWYGALDGEGYFVCCIWVHAVTFVFWTLMQLLLHRTHDRPQFLAAVGHYGKADVKLSSFIYIFLKKQILVIYSVGLYRVHTFSTLVSFLMSRILL